MLSSKAKSVLAGVFFGVLALAAIFFLIPTGVRVPGGVKIAALSPDFWPTIIAWAAVFASAALILEATLLSSPSDDVDEDFEEQAKYDLATLPAALRTIVLTAALFVFYFTLSVGGMVAASIVLIAAMMLFFGERKYLLVIILSAFVPIALYIFFRFVANVPIPLGVFGS